KLPVMAITAVLSVTMILFSVIDIIGSLPIILDLKKRGVVIHAPTATFTAGVLMISFLFFGVAILKLFGVEVSSFALAGSLIIFFIGLEMVLGIHFFRSGSQESASGSIVPIAFPLLAGAGTLTTILSLRSSFQTMEIIIGIMINLLAIFIVLKSTPWLEKKLPKPASEALRKIFGILLLAIAIQMFRKNIA
ncbi:MAG TPA: MarC family protein, partial [Saprospiraceae bacterium]|nr:MarC family protein [Saprospiraceae bacterium]